MDYDGYYDDVQPTDDGNTKNQMDPEMVKRIAQIIGGALFLVVFSVVIMCVL